MVSIRFQQLILAVIICSYVNTAAPPAEPPSLPVPPSVATNSPDATLLAGKNELPPKKSKKKSPPKPITRRQPQGPMGGKSSLMNKAVQTNSTEGNGPPGNTKNIKSKFADKLKPKDSTTTSPNPIPVPVATPPKPITRRHPMIPKSTPIPEGTSNPLKQNAINNSTDSPQSIKSKIAEKFKSKSSPTSKTITKRHPMMPKTGNLPPVGTVTTPPERSSSTQSIKDKLAEKLKSKPIRKRNPMMGMGGGGGGKGIKGMGGKMAGKMGGAGGTDEGGSAGMSGMLSKSGGGGKIKEMIAKLMGGASGAGAGGN